VTQLRAAQGEAVRVEEHGAWSRHRASEGVRLRVKGLGLRVGVQGLRFKVWGLRFALNTFWFRISTCFILYIGLGFRIYRNRGARVGGSVQGSGSRVQGSRFGLQDTGFPF